MIRMSVFSEVPEGVKPVDYAIYASAKSFCRAFLDPDLKTKVARLEREISEFEEEGGFPGILR